MDLNLRFEKYVIFNGYKTFTLTSTKVLPFEKYVILNEFKYERFKNVVYINFTIYAKVLNL